MKKEKTETLTRNFSLSKDTLDKLKEMSEAEERTQSKIVRDCINLRHQKIIKKSKQVA